MNKLFKPITKKQNKNISFSLYMSILGMVLCLGCLAGTSWAWFAGSVSMDEQSIVSANAAIEQIGVQKVTYRVVEFRNVAEDGSTNVTQSIDTNYADVPTPTSFRAAAGFRYEVRANLGGTAKNKYLLVETPDGNFYTTDENSRFDIIVSETGSVNIYAVWGKPNEGTDIKKTKNEIQAGTGHVELPETRNYTIPAPEPPADTTEPAE